MAGRNLKVVDMVDEKEKKAELESRICEAENASRSSTPSPKKEESETEAKAVRTHGIKICEATSQECITVTSANTESRVVTLPAFFPPGFGGLIRTYLVEADAKVNTRM
jgi:hypothetical protein